MKISVKVKGLKDLNRLTDRIDKLLFSGMDKALELAEKTTETSYLQGRALNRVTGSLISSIEKKVFRRGGNITGALGSYRRGLAYAAFWERGGIRKGKHFAARAYLRPSLVDNLQKMAEVMAKEIEDAK